MFPKKHPGLVIVPLAVPATDRADCVAGLDRATLSDGELGAIGLLVVTSLAGLGLT